MVKQTKSAANAFAMLDALGGANSKREAKALKMNTQQEAQETREKADASWKAMGEKHQLLIKMIVSVGSLL